MQGNAPPPSRHDPSIPEPLSTVVMTALQPSDRARFKDASEAEQALREAWDRCLTQGLVHPAVLAMEETSHDKVPPRLHEPRGVAAQARVPVGAESTEVTAIDDKMLARTPPKQLVVVSVKNVRDDDPTTLQVREEKRPVKGDATSRGVGPTERKTPAPSVSKNDASGAKTVEDEIVTDVVSAQPKAVAKRSNVPLLVLVAILVLSAAFAGLYFGGVIAF